MMFVRKKEGNTKKDKIRKEQLQIKQVEQKIEE